jgi:hypothetical protein
VSILYLSLLGCLWDADYTVLAETRSYRYNTTDPTAAIRIGHFRGPKKRMRRTAHGSATHDLTVGIIADAFRRNPLLKYGGRNEERVPPESPDF